jgi:hypothetical protein
MSIVIHRLSSVQPTAIRVVRDPSPELPPIRESDARDAADPRVVEARINAIASDLAAECGGHSSDFALGAYRAEYRHLHALYLETLARLKAESFSGGYFPDETPEL